MHGQEARDFTFSLALKYHGYSISAQSYELYPHLAELNNLDFTLSRILIHHIPSLRWGSNADRDKETFVNCLRLRFSGGFTAKV